MQGLLSKVPDVKNIAIDLGSGEATIEMDKHIPTPDLKLALLDYPKYKIAEIQISKPITNESFTEEKNRR